MRFRTKDLMITVVPRVEAGINPELKKFCLFDTRICVAVSHAFIATGPLATQPLGCRTSIPTLCTDVNISIEPLMLNDREDLAVLRVELQETLKQLDELEGQLPSGLGTKANAEAVTKALEGVMQQIRKASSGLK
jgi:hypothetical protein